MLIQNNPILYYLLLSTTPRHRPSHKSSPSAMMKTFATSIVLALLTLKSWSTAAAAAAPEVQARQSSLAYFALTGGIVFINSTFGIYPNYTISVPEDGSAVAICKAAPSRFPLFEFSLLPMPKTEYHNPALLTCLLHQQPIRSSFTRSVP